MEKVAGLNVIGKAPMSRSRARYERMREAILNAAAELINLTDRHDQAVAVTRECKPDLALVNIQPAAGMMASSWPSS